MVDIQIGHMHGIRMHNRHETVAETIIRLKRPKNSNTPKSLFYGQAVYGQAEDYHHAYVPKGHHPTNSIYNVFRHIHTIIAH